MAAKKSLKSPLCQATKSNVFFVNKALGDLAVCETVKPGDEGPYIPNWAPSGGSVVLANPGNEKWQRIGSHFYLDAAGFTSLSIAWNPTLLKPDFNAPLKFNYWMRINAWAQLAQSPHRGRGKWCGGYELLYNYSAPRDKRNDGVL
ncbi:Similar to Uncharacterized protein YMR244W; acc. no. Q04018 [Pyronema omphalodes CBS 100304]|uniref:Similar to Uncharacterized protein YMR244W acc. no. Q04018 n=1 Tax=Pyronema omphalodes (strain CBS 100304) TaxID=1076935 RepID=U4LR60_PYROM|nr:Similar to Uncharacterized protein YMR244W; acc. no. Q04018 [Pyronema omphalodes CBS 100304]